MTVIGDVSQKEAPLLSAAALEEKLRAVGEERYHHQHPFHLLMHEGKLTRGQLQAWAFNRYYYQKTIPIKDALILARSDSPEFRRAWRKRIVDHDGEPGTPGGIEKWIKLAEATGVPRDLVISERGVLPAVRYAVDAYLALVTKHSFLEAVASSLTEMFSKSLISLRMDRMIVHYPYLSSSLGYFESRLVPGARGRQLRAELGEAKCAHPRRTGFGDRRLARQVRYSVGAIGRALFRLRAAGLASAGRFPARGGLRSHG